MKKTLSKKYRIAAKKIKIFFTDIDGTLTDGFTYYSAQGEALKRFNHKDGAGVQLLRMQGIQFGIITTEETQIVHARAKKLNADYCFTGIENKNEFLQVILKKKKINYEDICFIGDDLNDLDVVRNAGISFAVGDAVAKVKEVADFTCKQNGGFGAFREAVDFLLSLRNDE